MRIGPPLNGGGTILSCLDTCSSKRRPCPRLTTRYLYLIDCCQRPDLQSSEARKTRQSHRHLTHQMVLSHGLPATLCPTPRGTQTTEEQRRTFLRLCEMMQTTDGQELDSQQIG